MYVPVKTSCYSIKEPLNFPSMMVNGKVEFNHFQQKMKYRGEMKRKKTNKQKNINKNKTTTTNRNMFLYRLATQNGMVC